MAPSLLSRALESCTFFQQMGEEKGKKAHLLVRLLFQENVPSAHLPLVSLSHMVYLHAKNAGRCSPWMGIHIPIDNFPLWKGNTNIWWASLSQRASWGGRAQREHSLCSCLYLAWHTMPHLSDSFIHSFAKPHSFFPTCFPHAMCTRLCTHIYLLYPIRPIQALRAQWLSQS